MQENETNEVEAAEKIVDETIEETTDIPEDTEEVAETKPEVKLSTEEQAFQDLQTERMGTFKVGMGYVDAVYFRNLLDKSGYKGPQQAYLLIVAKSELSGVAAGLKDNDRNKRYEVDLSAACIESLGFFMNNYEGKGSDSAGKLFSASMLLRPAMGIINNLDEKLAEAKKTLEDSNK
jgi:hypothetical protein